MRQSITLCVLAARVRVDGCPDCTAEKVEDQTTAVFHNFSNGEVYGPGIEIDGPDLLILG